MIVGISGFSGVGKDTVGEILYDYLPEMPAGTISESFAYCLKADLQTFIFGQYGFSILDCKREQKEKVRDFLVFWAEKRRKENPTHWIERLHARVIHSVNKCNIIITDVRYKNEAEWIHSLGGQVWLLERDGINPANMTEKQSIPAVSELADRIIELPTVDNLEELDKLIKSQLE